MVKEDLPAKAGYSMPVLMVSNRPRGGVYAAPKQVDSKASLLRKGHNWLISVVGRGGDPIVDDRRSGRRRAMPRRPCAKAAPAADGNWCWN